MKKIQILLTITIFSLFSFGQSIRAMEVEEEPNLKPRTDENQQTIKYSCTQTIPWSQTTNLNEIHNLVLLENEVLLLVAIMDK